MLFNIYVRCITKFRIDNFENDEPINISINPDWSFYRCQHELTLKLKKWKHHFPPHRLLLIGYQEKQIKLIYDYRKIPDINKTSFYCYYSPRFDLVNILNLAPTPRLHSLTILCLKTLKKNDLNSLIIHYDIPNKIKKHINIIMNKLKIKTCYCCKTKFEGYKNHIYCSRKCALEKEIPINIIKELQYHFFHEY